MNAGKRPPAREAKMCCLAKLATAPNQHGQLSFAGVFAEPVYGLEGAGVEGHRGNRGSGLGSDGRPHVNDVLEVAATTRANPPSLHEARFESCKYLDLRLYNQLSAHLRERLGRLVCRMGTLARCAFTLFHGKEKMLAHGAAGRAPVQTAQVAGQTQESSSTQKRASASRARQRASGDTALINESVSGQDRSEWASARDQDACERRREGARSTADTAAAAASAAAAAVDAATEIKRAREEARRRRVPRLLIANLIIFIAHSIALVSNIDYELLAELSREARSLTLQNFQSRVLDFNQATQRHPISERGFGLPPTTTLLSMHRAPMLATEGESRPSCLRPSRLNGDNGRERYLTAATSQPPGRQRTSSAQPTSSALPSHSGVPAHGQKTSPVAGAAEATHFHYYLLIVTLMDFLSAIHWHAGRAGNRASRLRAKLNTRSCSGSCGAEASASVRVGASDGPLFRMRAMAVRSAAARWLRALVLLLASPKYLFQLAQVLLVTLATNQQDHSSSAWPSPSLRRLASLMSLMNFFNQTVAYALRAYEAIFAPRLGPDGPDQRESEGLGCESEEATVADNQQLPKGRGDLRLLTRLKCYLMISRICHLKLTIMTLLLHLDSVQKPFELTPANLALSACVIQTLIAMYERYNEYHTKYSGQISARQDKSHKSLEIGAL